MLPTQDWRTDGRTDASFCNIHGQSQKMRFRKCLFLAPRCVWRTFSGRCWDRAKIMVGNQLHLLKKLRPTTTQTNLHSSLKVSHHRWIYELTNWHSLQAVRAGWLLFWRVLQCEYFDLLTPALKLITDPKQSYIWEPFSNFPSPLKQNAHS